MSNFIISDHAYDRMKERLGLNKKAALRLVEKAYTDGLKHSEIDSQGSLFKYISKRALISNQKGTKVTVYGEAVYIFIDKEDEIIVKTVMHLPNNLKQMALKLQEKKRNDNDSKRIHN